MFQIFNLLFKILEFLTSFPLCGHLSKILATKWIPIESPHISIFIPATDTITTEWLTWRKLISTISNPS